MIIEHFRGEHGLKQALNTMLKLKSENPQYYYALYPLDETLFDEWKENGYGVYTSMWWTNTPMFYQVLNKKYSFIPVSIDPVEKIVSDAAFDIEILGLFGTRLENAEWCINQEDAIAGVILNFDRAIVR